MTPREYERRIWASMQASKRDHKRLVSVAWFSAMFERQKRLQNLQTILTPPRRLSAEEQQRKLAEHESLIKEFKRK